MNDFRRLRRKLAKALPLPRPVRVMLKPPPTVQPRDDGYCVEVGKWCYERKEWTNLCIYIHPSLSAEDRCETLCHEWAHGLHSIGPIPHDQEWRKHYRAARRVWRSL